MTKKDTIESMARAIQFSLMTSKVNPYRIAMAISQLDRLGREARTHAENVCSRPMAEGADARKRKSISDRAARALKELALDTPYAIEVHGDPRGSCLQVMFKGAMTPFRF